MATKAQLVGQQELLQLCCVVCGVSLRQNLGQEYDARTNPNYLEVSGTVKGLCRGACIYPVTLETVLPANR